MRHPTALAAVAAASFAALVAAPPTATADPVVSDPIVEGLAGPAQLDVDGKDRIWVAQSFAGLLSRVKPDGSVRDVVSAAGQEIAGVAVRGRSVAFTFSGGSESNPVTRLKVRRADGSIRTVVNLSDFESDHNPDAVRHYGFGDDLDEACAEQIPEEAGGGEGYPGVVESHPYSLANAPGGGWYVADAAGNDVLHVSRSGAVRVVHVATPVVIEVTEEIAAGTGMPDCVVGHDYGFEPVPTDVEIDRDGNVWVSELGGGPEGPDSGLPAHGRLVRVDPASGAAEVVATGLAGATNVAVRPNTEVAYVTEILGGSIARVNTGTGAVKTLVGAPTPSAVEWVDGGLLAAVNMFGPGQIVRIDL